MKRIITKTKSMKIKLIALLGLIMFAPIVFYAQLSYTFTNCGATGRLGPTQLDVNTAYGGGNSLNGLVNVLGTGIQQFTVPSSGTWIIETRGAQGGGANGGLGAVMSGEFNLTSGDVLHIIVGQEGLVQVGEPFSVGGGGGSFVVKSPATSVGDILVIAGGGGGSPATHSPLRDAVIGQNGNDGAGTTQFGTGGIGGNGGNATQRGAGGGGFSTNGQSSTQTAASAEGGFSFLNGGNGGNHNSTGVQGSFGGGGASWQTGFRGAGGGGGYSGGGGAQVNSVANTISGGGGGSYNIGLNQSNTAGVNSGDGLVIITQAIIPVPCSGVTTPTISSPASTVCVGQAVNIGGSGATQSLNVAYQWQQSSTQGGPYTPSGATTSVMSSYQIPSVASGTVYYVLTATCTANSNSITSNEIAVVGAPVPNTPTAAATQVSVCAGQTAQLNAGSTTSGVNYVWSGPDGFTSNLQNPNIVNTSTAATGIYTVFANFGICNSTGAAFAPLSVVQITADIVSTKTVACLGTSDTLYVSSNAATSYTWNTGAQTSSLLVNPLVYTTFSVTVSNAVGCATVASFDMSVINATMSVLGAWDCNNGLGGSGVLTAQTFTPSMVSWYASPTSTDAIAQGTANALGESYFSINNAFADSTLWVKASSGSGGGTDSLETPLDGGTQNVANMFDISAKNDPLVVTGFDVLAGTATNVWEIWWNPISVASSGTGQTGWQLLTTYTFVGLGTGSFYHTIPLPNELPVAANQTVGLYFVPVSGIIYYNTTAALGTIRAQNNDMVLYGGRRGANFNGTTLQCGWNGRVHYKKGGGCSSPMTPVTLTISPQPTVSLVSTPALNTNASPVAVCSNETYTLTASGAFSYTWTNGINTLVDDHYVVFPANGFPDYFIDAESIDGCTNSTSFSLLIKPAPNVTAASFTNSICPGDNITLFVLGDALTYTWSANANSSHASVIVLAPNQSGLYTVAGTATNGCSSSSNLSVTVNVPDAISASSSKPNGICAGETVNLTATGAVTYTWTSNNSTLKGAAVVAKPEITTNYLVESTDANGCHNSTTIQQKVDACVGITELGAMSDELRVYPNPNNGAFTIELNNGAEKTLELYDLTGRVVFANTTKQDVMNMNIQELANGIYYLKVKSNNTVETVKIVKQ